MNDAAAAGAEAPISKSEFARRRNVTPGRVSQWIAEGKIDRAALAGEGREQQIIETVAVEQLRNRLNAHQRLGNGGATRLNLDAPPQEAPAPAPEPTGGNVVVAFAKPAAAAKPTSPTDELGEKIRLAQLEGMERRNRREAAEEAAEAGRFVDAEQARQQMGRLAAQLVTAFEGSLADFAAAISAKWQLPQRDVLHLLRTAYRDVRGKQAAAAKAEAEATPPTVEAEVIRETEPA